MFVTVTEIESTIQKKKNQSVILTVHIFQYLVKINDFSIHYFLGLKDQLIVLKNTKDHRLLPAIQLEIPSVWCDISAVSLTKLSFFFFLDFYHFT